MGEWTLHVLLTCPSIMYEIIMMLSVAESGNLRGSFVVSISYASTTGSGRSGSWGSHMTVT